MSVALTAAVASVLGRKIAWLPDRESVDSCSTSTPIFTQTGRATVLQQQHSLHMVYAAVVNQGQQQPMHAIAIGLPAHTHIDAIDQTMNSNWSDGECLLIKQHKGLTSCLPHALSNDMHM
jgi:hypothetical protein